MTGLDLITGSLRLIGAIAPGESPSSTETNDALLALNDLIDSWSTESLLIPNKVRELFPLVSGQTAYTMGVGGNWNTSRPQKIENALIQMPGSVPLELPMKILSKDEYAAIKLKQAQGTFPLYLYSDNANPLTTINVWPNPQTTYNVVLYSWKPLSEFTLTGVISLPPGYARALRFNLAVELCPEYGREPREDVIGIAAQSKAEIKRMNTTPRYLRCDDAVMGRPAVWNWMTGEPQ